MTPHFACQVLQFGTGIWLYQHVKWRIIVTWSCCDRSRNVRQLLLIWRWLYFHVIELFIWTGDLICNNGAELPEALFTYMSTESVPRSRMRVIVLILNMRNKIRTAWNCRGGQSNFELSSRCPKFWQQVNLHELTLKHEQYLLLLLLSWDALARCY